MTKGALHTPIAPSKPSGSLALLVQDHGKASVDWASQGGRRAGRAPVWYREQGQTKSTELELDQSGLHCKGQGRLG
eukprot:764932-Hanusia_phi.AAC.10